MTVARLRRESPRDATIPSEVLADCNPDFDRSLRRTRGSDAEAERRAFMNAGGHAKTHFVRVSNLSGAATGGAPFSPHLASSSAARAGPAKRHAQRHEHAPERFLRTDDDLSGEKGLARASEKRVAHAIEHTAYGWKIDRDLVG